MIPHQANIRIIEQVAKRLQFPMEKRVREHPALRQHVRGLDPDRDLRG